MTKKTEPIRFAGAELGENRHACAFFNSDVEAYRILLPFISDGFACGDKAVHLVNDLIEFEARVNHLWARHEDAVICVYDLAKFGGDTVIDVMRTHPMIVIGGILQQNPFFVPPEQFVRERRAQQAVE